MWTPEHRCAADRHGLRYPSDLSNAEWALVKPMIPPARRGGRKRSIDVREVLNAIFYVLWTGCQWKALPKDLPPKSTAHYYFMLWDWDGTLERIHHALYVAVREQAGREASPTVAIIDSQSAKPPKKGLCARPAGLRCGQEGHGTQAPYPRRYARPIAERCRSSRQHSRSRRHRIGAQPAHAPSVPLHRTDFCHGGYQEPKATAAAARTGTWKIQIVRRLDTAIGFKIVPKRWIVERTIAWINRFRRLARDFECYARTVAAFIRLAMVRIMLLRRRDQTFAAESKLLIALDPKFPSGRNLLRLCNPGDGRGLSEFNANPALAKKRWREKFREPLNYALGDGFQLQDTATSPILATLQGIALERFTRGAR